MKNNKNLFKLIGCIGLLGCGFLNIAFSETMIQVIDTVLNTHPNVLSSQANYRAAKDQTRKSQADYYPAINLDAAKGIEYSYDDIIKTEGDGAKRLYPAEIGASVSQMLYNGGATRSGVIKSRAGAKVARAQTDLTRLNMSFEAIQVYLNVSMQRVLLTRAQENESSQKELLAKISSYHFGGLGTKTDIALATSKLQLAKSQVAQAKTNLDNARADYLAVVGHDAVDDMQPPQVPFDKVPSSLIQAENIAEKNNPALDVAKSTIKSSIANYQNKQSTYYPTLSLDYNYDHDSNIAGTKGPDYSSSLVLTAKYNLFNGGADRESINIAAEQKEQALQNNALTLRQVKQNVQQAWSAYSNGRDNVDRLKEYYQYADMAYQDYVKQFDVGRRNVFELLGAKTDAYDAQTAYITAAYQYVIDTYKLFAQMGILDQAISNNAKVQDNKKFLQQVAKN